MQSPVKMSFAIETCYCSFQNTGFFLPKIACPHFPLDSVYIPWATFKIICMHLPFPANLYFLSTWKTPLLDKSNFPPSLYLHFHSWKCLEENTQLCCLMYLWPKRALTDTQQYCYICRGQSFSHSPSENNFVPFSLSCNI